MATASRTPDRTRYAPPALPLPLLRRQRLLERLAGAERHRLTLVHAAAGYGKTTLLAQHADLLRASGQRMAWLTLPRGAVHACTDNTGFGLIGHGSEMAAASGVTLAIDANRVPIFNGVREIANANRSAGLLSNQAHYGAAVAVHGAAPDVLALFYDPQTSGGLLIAATPEWADRVAEALQNGGVQASRVGSVTARQDGVLIEIVV